MNIKQIIKPSLLLMIAVGLSACGGSNSSDVRKVDCSDCAVITSVAADFGSSAIDFVETSFPYSAQTGFAAQDLSDIRAVTYGDHFYRLGRFQQDNISKWSFDNANAPVWEFSLGEGANPYDVIFVSDTKAYVLLWGAAEIKVIDPSVSSNLDEVGFNSGGSIDLSAYDQGTGSNAAAAILDNGFLYVVLEGLDASFVPQTSYLLKIDTSDDTEKDVNGSTVAGLGYALDVKNAGDIELLNDNIYVAGKGRYASSFANRLVELTGGIEKIDISGDTFTSTLLVDDDNSDVNAQITSVEIASATKGYFVRYNAWQDSDLISFNSSTGEVEAQPLAGYTGKDIKFIEVDDNNQLWIGLGSATDPRINILSTLDESSEGTIALTRNPSAITFADTTN
jgi:hypothetical protein